MTDHRPRRVRSYAAAPSHHPAASGWRRPVALAASALVVLGCGVALGRVSAGDPPRSGQETQRAAGRASRAGVPSGFARTGAGAAAAAMAYLYAFTLPVVLDPDRFERLVDAVSAPAAKAPARAFLTEDLDELRATYATAPRVARVAPVGYRIDRFSPRAATVSVWNAAIAASGDSGPGTAWRTLTLELIWTDGDWKVAGGRDQDGPSPQDSAAVLAAEARSFQEPRHVP